MHFFTTCLILTALAGTTNGSKEPIASEVYRCDFEADIDRNYDAWPDGWTRRRDRGYPDYVQIGIVPYPEAEAPAKPESSSPDAAATVSGDPSAVAASLRQCMAIELDGGAGSATSPPIAISSRYSFIFVGQVRTRGLKHDWAEISLSFFDENNTLLETFTSRPAQPSDWTAVQIGPVAPQDSRAKYARIALTLRPKDSQEDLTGIAWFDDLQLLQVPRMTLRTSKPTGLYQEVGSAEVICDVSGVSEADPRLTFELLDHQNLQLATHTVAVSANRKPQPAARGAKDEVEPFAGTASWKPPVQEFGFYRVRVTMSLTGGAILERSVTLATLRPLTAANSGEFGWSLPGGEQPLALEELGPLLGDVGIHWAKFPVWYRNPDEAWTDRLAWFAERLSLQSIEMVGLLDHPPVKAGDSSTEKDQPPIASLFIESGIWDDAVEPLMTRLSLKVRWWQLGGDDDTSFVGLPNADLKIAEVKQQFNRFGQEIRLGIPWRWVNEPSKHKRVPWEFLSLTTDPPLTADEIAVYLEGPKTAPAIAPNDTALGKPPMATKGSPAVTARVLSGEGVKATLTNSPIPSRDRRATPTVDLRGPKRWIILAPLARESYSTDDRVQDLVMRMLAAKIHGADAIFVPQPFSTDHGLMNDDGTPGELLVPWRTMATTISGAEYIGQIELPGGSTNHVFARGREAFMIVWNDQPASERLSLGEGLRQMDLWGRELPIEQTEQDGQLEHRVAVGSQPTIIAGLNQAVARWQIELAFDSPRLASIFGREQPLTMRAKNGFGQAIGGEITVRSPKSWDINPRVQRFKLAEGDELKQTFPVSLHVDASSGPQPLEIDFEVVADRTYRFRVYRVLQLGLEGLAVEMKTRLVGDDLVVEQTINNLTDEPISLQCMLFPPGRRRETKQVIQQGKGRQSLTFTLPNGIELLGQTIRMRAEEIGSARVLNNSVIAER
jgi:hypothetical protein